MRNLGTLYGGVRLALGLGVSLSLVSCSLKSASDDASIYVDLSALKSERAHLGLLSSGGSPFHFITTPPTSASGFSCYAVNVTGPGIGDSSQNPNTGDLGLKFSQLVNGQTYCSYRGVVSPPIFLDANSNADAVLQIPPAGIRLVQLVGVNDAAICASGVIDDQTGSNNNSSGKFFEVGRAVVNDVFGDRSVNVAMDWPAASVDQLARAMDCGNGCGMISSTPEGGSPASTQINAGNPIKLAFKIPTVVGKYLHQITVPLRASGTATLTATLSIYTTLAGSGIVSGVDSGYHSSMSVPVAANASPVDFSLYDAALGGYLQMVAAYDYWAVLTSDATGADALNISHNSGSSSTDVKIFSGSTWSTLTTAGIINQVQGCSN